MEFAVELGRGDSLAGEVALHRAQALLREGQVIGFRSFTVGVGTNDDMEFGLFVQGLGHKGQFGLLFRRQICAVVAVVQGRQGQGEGFPTGFLPLASLFRQARVVHFAFNGDAGLARGIFGSQGRIFFRLLLQQGRHVNLEAENVVPIQGSLSVRCKPATACSVQKGAKVVRRGVHVVHHKPLFGLQIEHYQIQTALAGEAVGGKEEGVSVNAGEHFLAFGIGDAQRLRGRPTGILPIGIVEICSS